MYTMFALFKFGIVPKEFVKMDLKQKALIIAFIQEYIKNNDNDWSG